MTQGLAFCWALRIPKQISTSPFRGQLFENMVVNEMIKMHTNTGKDAHLFFYRPVTTRSGHSVFNMYNACNKQIKNTLFFVKLNHHPIFFYFILFLVKMVFLFSIL